MMAKHKISHSFRKEKGAVRPKKHLGQHFLKDESIAEKMVGALSKEGYSKVLEIGPGMGVLTKYLIQEKDVETWVIEIDAESIAYIKVHFPELDNRIISGDFLKLDVKAVFNEPFAVIGNFPYNISSQILFKVYEHKNQVPEVIGMFQKEVAQRIASPPGNKNYGILSVLLQAFYKIEYLFTIDEHLFDPPPKVKSAVLHLVRNEVKELGCDETRFKKIVKQAFNQRRKTLRNALKPLLTNIDIAAYPVFSKRAEQLSVNDFVELTNLLEESIQSR